MSRLSRLRRRAVSRRQFVAGSAAAAASTALVGCAAPPAAPMSAPAGAHARGEERIRVGLIGCGGRGTGAASQALHADPAAVLVAAGDVFMDRVESSLKHLSEDEEIKGRVQVAPEMRFSGFDAYKKVIEQCDVVLLAATPHFRPDHLRAAVEAGKHIFCEKPVAVDATGIRSVLASAEMARQKGLSLVCGFCWRYADADKETYARIHDGAIGQVVNMNTYYLTGNLGLKPRKPEWSDMEYQLRNWYYYTWLSGDHIVEQAVHSIDKISWAMQNAVPTRAIAIGGRQVRTDPVYGHVFDHFGVVYEFKNGARATHMCRQTEGCYSDNTDYILGTKGSAAINSWGPDEVFRDHSGKAYWKWDGERHDMYQNEHDFLFRSIRARDGHNDGVWMANSCMMAIMGRMSAYTGQAVTWEQALNSKEDLRPAKYEFGPLPTPPVAVPGRVKLT